MAYKNVAPTEYTETQFFLFGSSRVVGQAQKKLRGAKKIPAADEFYSIKKYSYFRFLVLCIADKKVVYQISLTAEHVGG